MASTSNHPVSQGGFESVHQNSKAMGEKFSDEASRWDDIMLYLLFALIVRVPSPVFSRGVHYAVHSCLNWILTL